MKKLTSKQYLIIASLIFGMFFGAGNLIFPPHLGAQAGANLWPAFAGFAVSAIGLPIMGVAAVANAGGLDRLCDLTVAIIAPREARVKRLIRRDGISREYAVSRINAQHDDAWFRRRCGAVLENDGTQDEFHKKCIDFLDAHGIISLA